jgi:VWA domain-containing protein
VIRDEDRVAIMVFDRSTRLRMPFRSSREAVERELQTLLRQETFRGGTDITRGLLDAADYVARNARRDARRAIVIVTDDQTERDRNEAAVSRALTRADAVLCALIAPDMMRNVAGYPGGGGSGRGGGGTWPGGSAGGPLGGIILGRRGPYGGRPPYGGGGRGPGAGMPHTQSAGTEEIARQSGGDSMPLSDASDLETTLTRIRQRYALHFHLPQGVQPGQERNIEVDLAAAARRRYPDAEVRYRRVYIAPDAHGSATGPTVVTRAPAGGTVGSADPYGTAQGPVSGRRPAVSEPSGPYMGGPSTGEAPRPAAQPQTQTAPAPSGGWPSADAQAQQPAPSDSTTNDQQSKPPRWRELKPGEQP